MFCNYLVKTVKPELLFPHNFLRSFFRNTCILIVAGSSLEKSIFSSVYKFQKLNNLTRFGNPSAENDGNCSDSDEENEELFRQQYENQLATQDIKEEEKVEGKAEDKAPNIKQETQEVSKAEEVSLGDSDESEGEPLEYDLILGQYDEIQRIKKGRRYRCKFIKAILRLNKRDYITANLNAEIIY